MAIAPSDIPDEVVAIEIKILTNTHPRNRAHGLHEGGNSSGVPSSKRWRSILVGFIVVIEAESVRLWSVEPLESGMAFQICITEGLVSLRTKSTRGIANKPPPMIRRGSILAPLWLALMLHKAAKRLAKLSPSYDHMSSMVLFGKGLGDRA